jgi:hypothetical protein
MLGMIQGKSMTANWTDYRFVLTPSTVAQTPSTLEYFEIVPPGEQGAAEEGREGRGGGAGGGADSEPLTPEPHSVLLVKFAHT